MDIVDTRSSRGARIATDQARLHSAYMPQPLDSRNAGLRIEAAAHAAQVKKNNDKQQR
jgi:hypothetical protein